MPVKCTQITTYIKPSRYGDLIMALEANNIVCKVIHSCEVKSRVALADGTVVEDKDLKVDLIIQEGPTAELIAKVIADTSGFNTTEMVFSTTDVMWVAK